MGCNTSKDAVVAAPPKRRDVEAKVATTTTPKTKKNPLTAADLRLPRNKDGWKVHPGYSSGASSYSGSDRGEDDDDDDEAAARHHHQRSSSSRHSGILALSALRDEMAADGDLAKTLVRIETPFDTPIEEIYEGVLNGPVLGSGVSGVVRLVVHRATGVKYAVKVLDLGLIDTTEGLKQLRNEIFIMCQLDHPNIVRIEEVYESTNEIYIVQELCLGGDLFDRLDQQVDFHYTEAQCARLVKQMLSSIRYIHSKGIIHRDLKLENFLFSSSSAESELKMIDFGLSKHFEIGQPLNDKVGTPYTVAPEIIEGSYDEKCDMWSLGVITYLLLSGETPFGGLDGENLMLVKQNIMRAQLKFKPDDVWENVSSEGKAFVKTMLQLNPNQRPNAKEAQRCGWIQVWAKKDTTEGNQLNPKTVGALMKFKESSDMQKLLSEVLSFTLLPEQIVFLREEFEKMDSHGDGEISLGSLKRVLMINAEVGALGALTEKEIEEIFDSIRVRKTEPTIRWHEFLAAGLSQARVDDRNLRLAFDRLDNQRKGFITFDDLYVILGNSTENEALEKMWLESLDECKAHLDRITFDDFKKLMKGQPQEVVVYPPSAGLQLAGVPEDEEMEKGLDGTSDLAAQSTEKTRAFYKKTRSASYEQKRTAWESHEFSMDPSMTMFLTSHAVGDYSVSTKDTKMSPLVVNRAIYRKHRELRLAVLDASKQFDAKRTDMQTTHTRASLIMKRGGRPPVAVEDAHARAMFEQAAIRCGRTHKKNKTVSDVTDMLIRAKE